MDDANALAHAARAALSALHAGTATPDAIKKADLALDHIKNSLNASLCIQVVQILLSPLLSPAVHSTTPPQAAVPEVHFGFLMLDEVILRSVHSWASFPDDVRASVRHIAVTLFQQVSTVDSNGARTFRFPAMGMEKTIALLSGVAIREWPQRWPTFLDELLADPRRAETSCHVLQVMSENVHDYPDLIESARRQELMHAMALTLPKTLNFVTSAANTFLQQRNLAGLNSSVATLQSFFSWASLHTVFSAHVPEACFVLLHDRNTRGGALPALSILVNRQFSQHGSRQEKGEGGHSANPEAESDVVFRDVVFNGILEFVTSSSVKSIGASSLLPPSGDLPALLQAFSENQALEEIDADEHKFHVEFFNMLADLGSVNFYSTFLFSKRKGLRVLKPNEERSGMAFIDLMLCAASSSSFSIRLAVQPFFASILGTLQKYQDTLQKNQDTLQENQATPTPLKGLSLLLVVGYLHAAFLALIRFPTDNFQAAAQFEDEDFDDDGRLQKDLFENFTARTINSLGLAAKLCPDFASVRGLQRFLKLLSVKPLDGKAQHFENAPSSKFLRSPRSLGLVVPDGSKHGWEFGRFGDGFREVWVSCLSTTIMSTEAMVTGSAASKLMYNRNEMLQLMLQAFKLTNGISEESLLPLKANALRMFSPMYAQEPKALESCFDTLVLQGVNLAGTSESRFKACLAISTLCRRLGSAGLKTLGKYRVPMCQQSVKALGNQQFEVVNKILLLEASISTVLVLGSLDEQTGYIEHLFGPVLKSLSSSKVKDVLQGPTALFNFIKGGNPRDLAGMCEAFQIMEAGVHQIVRPSSKANAPASLQGVLSRSIAPRAVEVAAVLVHALHALFNRAKFPLDDPQGIRGSVLQPTSREITALLNLDTSFGHWRREHINDQSQVGDNEQLGSIGEQKSNEVLRQYGIEPPDPKHSQKRETLKNLRRSAYEILRSAIFSGVTIGANTYLNAVLKAITADCEYIEPIHLVQLTNKVLRPLLSFPVVAVDSHFLESVSNSNVPRILQVIRGCIEQSKLGEIVGSGSLLLDVARDDGRKALARSAADMISNMYPRPQKKAEGQVMEKFVYTPPVFSYSPLGDEMISLWRAICNPGRSFPDNGAARVGFTVVISAVDMAPANSFSLFGPLLETSLITAVENNGLREDSPLESAIGSVASIIRKWPAESEKSLHTFLADGAAAALPWVTECVNKITGSSQASSKPKKHRGFVRDLVSKVADLANVPGTRKNKVKALPEKLVMKNVARSRNKRKNDHEEVELIDEALDSLFGDGDPL